MRITKEYSSIQNSLYILIIEDRSYFLSEVGEVIQEKLFYINRADKTRIPGKIEPGYVEIIAENKLTQYIL